MAARMGKRKPPQWRTDFGTAGGLLVLSLIIAGVYGVYLDALTRGARARTELVSRLRQAQGGLGSEKLVEGVVVARGQYLPMLAPAFGYSPVLVAAYGERRRESSLGTGPRSARSRPRRGRKPSRDQSSCAAER